MKKISKSSAVSKMRASKGRFFTVVFEKQNGDKRTMNGNVKADRFMTDQGYVLVRESGSKKKIRSVNPRSIKSLTISGEQFTIRKS
tara:strand:- start:12506 stop:12763 length:258 start_codon:yes stop_codon:yes gene_type:complete